MADSILYVLYGVGIKRQDLSNIVSIVQFGFIINMIGFIKKNWFLVIFCIVLLITVRWNSFTSPFERDEGEYAYSAWIMQKGYMPYEHSFLQKPPLIVYTYLLGQVFFGNSIWAPRLLAFIFVIFSSFIIFQISLIQFNKRVAWVSTVLFLFLVSSPFNASLAANTEVFMLLPMLGAIYIYVKRGVNANRNDFILSSSLAITAILYKPICIYLLIFVYTYWGINIYKKTGLNKTINFIVISVLSSITTLFIWLFPFLLSGNIENLWEQVVVFNSMYVKYWGWGIGNFVRNIIFIWPSFWLIYFLVCAYFVIHNKYKMIYLGLILTSLFAVYQTSIRHYFLIMMPFLAITSSFVLVQISNLQIIKRLFKSLSLTFLTVTVVIVFIWPARNQFALTPEQLSIFIYGTVNPFIESILISNEVAKITSKNDCIYVAGSEPQIYFYAQRVSCTKFDISYPINLNTPKRDQYQKQIKSDLEKIKPEVIVVSNREESGFWDEKAPQYFIEYFKMQLDNYELIGAYVWNGTRGYYTNKPTDEEISKSSLLLYRHEKK